MTTSLPPAPKPISLLMNVFPNIESKDRVHPQTPSPIIKILICVLLCHFFIGCNYTTGQKTEQKSTRSASVQTSAITKEALLDCIQATVDLFSKQNYNRQSFNNLFDSLGKRYVVKIYKPESDVERSNVLGIFIGLNEATDIFDDIDFFLPETVATDLTYTDLSNRFGPWEKETDNLPKPKNMRPVTFKLINKTSSKTIKMQVSSDNSPEVVPNKIWKIEVIQMSKALKSRS